MRKRRVLRVLLVVALLLAAVVLAALKFAPDDMLARVPGNPLGLSTLPVPQAQQMPAADAQRLEQALASSDRQVQAGVLVPQIAQAYVAQGTAMWPPGTTFRLMPQTLVVSEPYGWAEAQVIMADGSTGKFLVHMQRPGQGGQWQVFAIEGDQ